jgi:hypothetical protein
VERLIEKTAMQLKKIHHIPLTVLAITVLPITAVGQIDDNGQSRSVSIVGRVTDVTRLAYQTR